MIVAYFKGTRHSFAKSDQHPRAHALILRHNTRASCMDKKIRLFLEEHMIGGGMRHQPANNVLIAINELC